MVAALSLRVVSSPLAFSALALASDSAAVSLLCNSLIWFPAVSASALSFSETSS